MNILKDRLIKTEFLIWNGYGIDRFFSKTHHFTYDFNMFLDNIYINNIIKLRIVRNVQVMPYFLSNNE